MIVSWKQFVQHLRLQLSQRNTSHKYDRIRVKQNVTNSTMWCKDERNKEAWGAHLQSPNVTF